MKQTQTSTRKTSSTNFGNQRILARACVLNDALYRIAMRWKMQVLYSVFRGHDSFGALKRELPSVTDHVLGRRLRELTAEGLLDKHPNGERRFVYTVTKRGRGLLDIMQRICDWEVAAPTI
ncbi:transcriptional regulator [Labilithrix luteola]|uniref:Transcriptional regulator n=1 Tax=Labilithrix luteola TaxID=1391654 RepID=A0A0K1PK69_9BACT|nr:helix-turn-helix domain-containing protein [Labilithrix luteola]AKU93786.1 transcriptional regulator [Labilithrix luteola]